MKKTKNLNLKRKNFLDLVPGVNFRVMKDAVLYFPQTNTQLEEISDKVAENDTEGFKKIFGHLLFNFDWVFKS